jgi:amino acid adenylation domain-containing protein
LFDQTTIERMVAQFQTLLEGIVRNPEQRISQLPLLSEAEKQQLLVTWNDTRKDYPKDKCLHELFETQVEKTPDAIALVFEDQQIPYRELNQHANQLAHHLRKLGVGPETLVGICIERSIEMIVGLLGILKAGGAYLPLDPSYPKERIAFMIRDSQAPVVLVQNKLLEQLPTLSIQNRIVCLDTDLQTVARESSENLTSGVRTENLAYVTYTSGSTGNPKGVMVEHRSLVNYLCWFTDFFVVEKSINLPLTTKLTFDASLKQLFPPLLNGGQLFLVSDEVINQPAKLIETIRCRDRFSLNCVPSLWNAVLDAIESDPGLVPPATLFSLLLGGENPSRQLLEKTFAAFSGLDLWNLYGPTEATVNATVARLHPDGPIIIGRPIANTQVYILDPHLNPAPIGAAGEIHIAGHGLARGYWNRSELTTEKFISNPFSDTPGARLYKTGDIARYLPDGNIEFLGRIDDQVKIRGYRIELGEIETVLGQHPAIQQAVVLAREDTPGDKRLVAYAVAAAGVNPSAHDLRSFLQKKLPEYMVPTSFMFLQSLPLNANGKLERKAFPPPDQCRPELAETYTTPRTPTEELLAGIWARVLKLDKVGIHDNFFELGGHSLLATQVISRIRDTFRLDLPLRTLFEAPTIFGLAQQVQELGEKPGALLEAKISRLRRENYRVQRTQ